jgi:hypothetical protein
VTLTTKQASIDAAPPPPPLSAQERHRARQKETVSQKKTERDKETFGGEGGLSEPFLSRHRTGGDRWGENAGQFLLRPSKKKTYNSSIVSWFTTSSLINYILKILIFIILNKYH